MDSDERDIPEGWTLALADLTLVMAKGRANRLGFAVLLLFYRAHGRFPPAPTEIEPQAVDQVERRQRLRVLRPPRRAGQQPP